MGLSWPQRLRLAVLLVEGFVLERVPIVKVFERAHKGPLVERGPNDNGAALGGGGGLQGRQKPLQVALHALDRLRVVLVLRVVNDDEGRALVALLEAPPLLAPPSRDDRRAVLQDDLFVAPLAGCRLAPVPQQVRKRGFAVRGASVLDDVFERPQATLGLALRLGDNNHKTGRPPLLLENVLEKNVPDGKEARPETAFGVVSGPLHIDPLLAGVLQHPCHLVVKVGRVEGKHVRSERAPHQDQVARQLAHQLSLCVVGHQNSVA